MTFEKLAFLLALFALAWPGIGEASAQKANGGPPPVPVKTIEARLVPMAKSVRLPGTAVAREDSRLAAELSGRIVWIAEIGTEIRAGEPVARIDDRETRLALDRAEVAIRRLEARLSYEEQQVGRLAELARTNHTPQSRYEEALANRAMVAEDLNEARIARETAELLLSRSVIRAPFDGQIAARLANTGEYASPGREMVRLVATRAIEIAVRVPIGQAATVGTGTEVSLDSGEFSQTGRVRAVIGAGDALSRSIEIRISTDALFPVGSAVEVGLPVGAERNVVAVPRDALILRPGQTFLWVVDDEGVTRRVDIATGAADGALIEVTGAVAAGDRVVIRGGERLRPGQKVTVIGKLDG